MTEPYLTELRGFIRSAKPPGTLAAAVSCKHFFGGAAAYFEDRIFISHTPAGLGLKLGESDRTALFELGGKPLRYFPEAPVKKAYVVMPPEIIADQASLASWISKSIEYVRGR